LCDKQPVLPVGMSDKLSQGRVKVYCPKCEEIYVPTKKFNLDGAFFGPSLPHIFLAAYKSSIVFPPKVYYYEPKLFGF
jgi:casein kinase II subunit beta